MNGVDAVAVIKTLYSRVPNIVIIIIINFVIVGWYIVKNTKIAK